MIRGRVDKQKNGLISIAGPVTNIILGIFFIILSFLFSNKLVRTVADYGAEINLFLAIFNMIPFLMLDGAKVWKWNKIIYVTTVVVIIALLFGRTKLILGF